LPMDIQGHRKTYLSMKFQCHRKNSLLANKFHGIRTNSLLATVIEEDFNFITFVLLSMTQFK